MAAPTSVIRINKGENFIVRRFLKDKNLNGILVSNLVSFTAEIRQFGQTLLTLNYPSANCRAAANTVSNYQYIVEIEIVQATSNLFQKGDLFIRTTAVAPDGDFVTDLNQKRVEEKLWAVVE